MGGCVNGGDPGTRGYIFRDKLNMPSRSVAICSDDRDVIINDEDDIGQDFGAVMVFHLYGLIQGNLRNGAKISTPNATNSKTRMLFSSL